MAQTDKEIGREWRGGAILPIMVTRVSGLWREKKLNKKRHKIIDVDTGQSTTLSNDEQRWKWDSRVDRILAVATNIAGGRVLVQKENKHRG